MDKELGTKPPLVIILVDFKGYSVPQVTLKLMGRLLKERQKDG